MHNEDPKKWGKEMKPKWDATAEDWADEIGEQGKRSHYSNQRAEPLSSTRVIAPSKFNEWHLQTNLLEC